MRTRRLIDQLLASPHYGERWARHWLDLARFAESHGFEHDYDRPTAYHYRDFVIKALNQDLPYDTFVKWQIAGDEFAPDNPLALTATGFLAAGVHSTQITANQVEKERYDELDDMRSHHRHGMLGLTIGCARCHDHKFDPIPTQDYYRLLSTFTTTVRTDSISTSTRPATVRPRRSSTPSTTQIVEPLAAFREGAAAGQSRAVAGQRPQGIASSAAGRAGHGRAQVGGRSHVHQAERRLAAGIGGKNPAHRHADDR